MIKVDGQFQLNATINGKGILDNHFDQLDIIQVAGSELPVMQIAFDTASNEIVELLNETQPISISLGSNNSDMLDAKFFCSKPKFRRATKDLWNVNAAGIHYAQAQWHKSSVTISEKMSAASYLIDQAKNIWPKVETNFDPKTGSNDNQSWIQHGIALKTHADNVWLHMDVGDSFPVMAATCDSFRLYDMKKLIQGKPKWIFSNTAVGDNVIQFDSNYDFEPRVGFMNSLGARGITINVHDLDKGASVEYTSKPQVLLATTNKLGQNKRFERVYHKPQTLSRNQHPNYWNSYVHNLTQLLLFSSYQITLMFKNKFHNIKPLDVVYFMDDDIVKRDNSSNEMASGLFIVTKVSHQVSGKSFSTLVQMTRDTFVLDTK